MIQSLFILSSVGEVLIERHFRGVVTSRSVCESFWDRASLSALHHGGVSSTTSLRGEHYDTVPPVMEVPAAANDIDQGTLYVISILRNGLSYLAVCPGEVSPLLVLEFLGRIHSIFEEYFGQSPAIADESSIKDNFSTVYQLLEEMIDYGWPLTTEPNALKAMIRPPTVMSKLLQTVQTAEELPSGTISTMPWRAAGVTYSQNEIYIDIVEEVDAIVNSSNGAIVSFDIRGSVQCQSHLSGVPDLLLTFKDPSLIDDASFHPCVRYTRFENDQIVSFVPPDGDFELMRYRIHNDAPTRHHHFQPPVYCHAQWTYLTPPDPLPPSKSLSSSYHKLKSSKPVKKTGRVVVQVGIHDANSLLFSASHPRNQKEVGGGIRGIRGIGTGGMQQQNFQVEDVAVTIPLPQKTLTADFRVTLGSIVYDEAAKVAHWNLGTVDQTTTASNSNFNNNFTSSNLLNITSTTITAATNTILNCKQPSLVCTFVTAGDEEVGNNLSLNWKVPLASVSGLTVSGLSITGEAYRCYKGVRNITQSGLYQIRC